MDLFLQLLPIYLLGNLHCMGMCGPLVALLGGHPFRYYYFLGRIFSFTLVGGVAGIFGFLIFLSFDAVHLNAWISFLFGVLNKLINQKN